MQTIRNKCEELIKQIDKTVDLLVKQDIALGVEELLVVIELMSNTIEELFTNKEELSKMNINIDEQHIIQMLKQVVEAIDNTDFVLVADLLNYEIKPTLEEYIQKNE